jgi:hypothetical protein
MIDLNSYCCVDLGNYLKHQQNYAKVIQSQQKQRDRLEQQLRQTSQEGGETVRQLRAALDDLKRLSSMEMNDFEPLRPFFAISQSCQVDHQEVLNGSKELIQLVVTELYQLELLDLEGMFAQEGPTGVFFAFLVETDYDQFKRQEDVCRFLDRLLRSFLLQFCHISEAAISFKRNDQYLEIEAQLVTLPKS